MPTLFTLLQARHGVAVPRRKAPTSRAGRGKARRSILQTELQSHIEATPKPSRGARKALRSRPSVIVVGAGFAGLCAAYELQGLGFDVKVFEARNRVGGRVFSQSDGFIPHKTMEKGAELIGANHPLWLTYRQHFGLRFSNVEDYQNSPVRIGSRTLSFEESKSLQEETDTMLKRLTDLAETIIDPFEPWLNRNARRLDRRSLADWLKRTPGSKECKQAIAEQLAADNGIPASQQSLLGVLAMIKGGGLDRYWNDTELFRCEGGSDQLAKCFEEQLNRGAQRVFKSRPVLSVVRDSGKVQVTVKGMAKPHEADHLILAIPPSVWSTIKFADRALQRRLNAAPRTGSNVKYLMRFHKRFWKDFGSAPTLSEDGPVDLTWETTESYSDEQNDFGLVAFSGSTHATTCSRWRSQARRAHYMEALKAPYPNIGAQIRKDEFVDWPHDPWSRGSYYFPRKNEIVRWGRFWRDGYKGWLHFAGEHTCYAFVGYMEGALNSGYRLARRLFERTQARY